MNTKELELKFYDDVTAAITADGKSKNFEDLELKYSLDNISVADWYGEDIYTLCDGMSESEVDDLWQNNKEEAYNDYMAEYQDVSNIASEVAGEVVETTSEGSGYPANIKDAIILSDNATFEDYEDAASKYGLSIIELHKCDGWQLWSRGGTALYPYNLRSFYMDKCYDIYDIGDDVVSMVKERISDMDDLDDMKHLIEDAEEIQDELNNIGGDEFVAYDFGNRRVEVYSNETCVYGYDVHTYQIALIK